MKVFNRKYTLSINKAIAKKNIERKIAPKPPVAVSGLRISNKPTILQTMDKIISTIL